MANSFCWSDNNEFGAAPVSQTGYTDSGLTFVLSFRAVAQWMRNRARLLGYGAISGRKAHW